MKTTTWHILPAQELTFVTDRLAISNDSEVDAHIELSSDGEIYVKPLDFGRISIMFLEPK